MSFTFVQELPSPGAIREEYPLPKPFAEIKRRRDQEIADVLTGKSDRFLVIIGPCSADNEDAVCEYVTRLAKVNEKVKDRLVLVPRIYTNKPRTTGSGYKGITSQPDPEGKTDFRAGLIAMRKMQIHAIEVSGLTAADEMLYPDNWGYVQDILSYVAIGARSVEDQQHRLTVSGFDVASGMKNPTSGDFNVMLNSIYAAQHPHSFIYRGWEAHSKGNPYAHAILRGHTSKHGRSIPNYHYEDILLLCDFYDEYVEKYDIRFPSLIIDTNHCNSDKNPFEQPRIIKEVISSSKNHERIRKILKGFMVESYIVDGRQDIGGGTYGQSITDPCLGWEKTEQLIYEIADMW